MLNYGFSVEGEEAVENSKNVKAIIPIVGGCFFKLVDGYTRTMKKLPDFEAWAIFSKVVEEGSFAKAADALSLSQATISKAITRLEKRTGTVLFHRTSRRMVLTDSGRSVLEQAQDLVEQGQAIEEAILEHSGTLRGVIRLSAPMSFGIASLAPVLPAFMQQYPDIRLHIEFNDKQVDVVADGFDLVLRIANLVDSSLLARRLCGVHLWVVGAPSYFEKYGEPTHPNDLAQHHLMLYAYTRQGASWHFKHDQLGEYTQTLPTPIAKVNNAEGFLPMLTSGLGLALLPDFLLAPYLKNNQLQVVMREWKVEPVALHIVTPPSRVRPARVQALMDYLIMCFEGKQWLV